MPRTTADVMPLAACPQDDATLSIGARKPDPSAEAQVLLADYSMEGVRFSRVREKYPFVARGVEGGFTLCYMVRRRSVWLEIKPPSQDPVCLELEPGAIVGLSGRVPHWFKSSRTAATKLAPPMVLRDFDPSSPDAGELEMLVGYAPIEVAASSGILSNEILVPPVGAERISRRMWGAAEAIEDELIDPDPLGATAAVVRRYAEVISLNMARLAFSRSTGVGLPGYATMRDPRLMRAMAAAASNPVAKWTVANLAQIAGMSRTAFSQTFRALTGTTPMHCVADIRLNFAAIALAQGSHNLEQLAAQIGYGSPESFIRAFQRNYGVTPGRWREHMARPGHSPLPT